MIWKGHIINKANQNKKYHDKKNNSVIEYVQYKSVSTQTDNTKPNTTKALETFLYKIGQV